MRSIIIALGLAATVATAADLGAQSQRPDVYGQRAGTATSGRTAQREYALDDYLDGISLGALQQLRVQRAWNSGYALERRLSDVRGQLTSTQQRRFDRNVADLQSLSQQGSYGTYGSNGTYDSRSREDGRHEARRDDDRRDAQRGKSQSAPHGKAKGHEKNGKGDTQRASERHSRRS